MEGISENTPLKKSKSYFQNVAKNDNFLVIYSLINLGIINGKVHLFYLFFFSLNLYKKIFKNSFFKKDDNFGEFDLQRVQNKTISKKIFDRRCGCQRVASSDFCSKNSD